MPNRAPSDAWLHSLDYEALENVPRHYVTEDLKHRADDIFR